MAKGFKHGAGGSNGLNFEVICNPKPDTAKENTIWVDTDKINNYYFSATQPENMVEYDVWFPVDTSGTVAFSATKKNHIMVYPMSAKQYVGGSLVEKDSKFYQNGQWAEFWDGTLYYKGDQYEAYTGGFIKCSLQNKTIPTVTFNDDSITITAPYGSGGGVMTDVPIDMTNYKTLAINITAGKFGTDRLFFGVTKNKDEFDNTAFENIVGVGTVQLDISHVTEEAYIAIHVNGAENLNYSLTMDRLKLS